MVAKSTLVSNGLNLTRGARWMRPLVSMAVLVASLTALLLIVHNLYGPVWLGESLRALPPEALTADASAARQKRHAAVPSAEEGRYRALAEFLAKRYRVSQEVTFDLVSLAHHAGRRMGLDPLLIIAVIAVESRFNPIAESVAGAQGLMQIIPQYHTGKLEEHGGARSVFDPATNIFVGARILKEYIRLTGNLGIALQMYAGALNDNEDQYANKVMNEKRRLQQVLAQPGERRAAPTKTAAVRPTRRASFN